jgi:DNA replication protein DnaC
MTENLLELTRELRLKWIPENLDSELAAAARRNRTPEQILQRLFTGELEAKRTRAAEARLKKARIPVVKTLDQFNLSWPSAINRDLVRHLFTLRFLDGPANVVFIGPVGVGKTHLAEALAYEACQRGISVLFTTAVAMIQELEAAQINGTLKREMRRYTSPKMLAVDELGYLPVDRRGADLLFQIFSARYERSSTVITTNLAYQDWAPCFNDDATVTAAVLDRLCHHCETVLIEGESYRRKAVIEAHPVPETADS